MTDQEIEDLQRENAQLRGKLQASAQPAVASLDDVRKVVYEAIASADCPAIAAAAVGNGQLRDGRERAADDGAVMNIRAKPVVWRDQIMQLAEQAGVAPNTILHWEAAFLRFAALLESAVLAATPSPAGNINPEPTYPKPPAPPASPALPKPAEARGVPVAKIVRNEAGQISMQTPAGEPFDMSRFVGCTLSATPAEQPIDMILYCPNCGTQHVDVAGHPHGGPIDDQGMPWDNPPHRSHLCAGCGTIWRPADVPTNGVAEIKTAGKSDTWPIDVKRLRHG